MIDIPKIAQLDIVVPGEVVSAVKKLLFLFQMTKLNKISLDNTNLTNTDAYILQNASQDTIKKYNIESLTDKRADRIIEQHGLATDWIIDSNEVKTIKQFLYTNFTAPFGFRIHYMGPGGTIADTKGHTWPRIFLPITNSRCEYTILDNDNIKHNMFYEVDKCYIWDVRLPHFVKNHDPKNGRIIAAFMLDPSKETSLKIKGL